MSVSQASQAPLFNGLDLASQTHDSCHIEQDPVAIYLSIFLCAGLVVSYLPQIIRIIVKKSSQGFSPWFLLLGATSSASSFLNVVALQWGIVRCCSSLSGAECARSLLGIAQVFLQWFMFTLVFILFLIYYPEDQKYERAIALPIRDEETIARKRAKKAAKKVAAARGNLQSSDGRLALPASSSGSKGKPKINIDSSADDASSAGSENSDLDSVDSHIAQNYGINRRSADADADDTSSDEGDAEELNGESGLQVPGDGTASPREASSSAFSRLTPTFWPMWKAPASGKGAMQAIEEGRVSGSNTEEQEELLAGAPRGLRRLEQERRAKALARRPKSRKRKTEEWSLAIALAWVVLIHFIFITSITLLLVFSLPPKSFPPPDEVSSLFAGIVNQHKSPAHAFGPSSRLLVSRWAAFLGGSATILAAGQYLPQIVHTARTKLVGSLSIPMMCLQVPGSAIFVYSLALQPGTNWTSLAAYVITGVLQFILLVLCVAWKIRQRRTGIDDFGRPVSMITLS